MLLHYFLEFNVLALPSNYFLQMRKATAPLEKTTVTHWCFETSIFCMQFLKAYLIYLFVSRHEVHSMNTHTLQNAG